MECDSSSYGLKVAVFQSKGVILNASRTRNKTKQKYVREEKMLTILFGCVRFEQRSILLQMTYHPWNAVSNV